MKAKTNLEDEWILSSQIQGEEDMQKSLMKVVKPKTLLQDIKVILARLWMALSSKDVQMSNAVVVA